MSPPEAGCMASFHGVELPRAFERQLRACWCSHMSCFMDGFASVTEVIHEFHEFLPTAVPGRDQ